MKKIFGILLCSAALCTSSGCAVVTSSNAGLTNATGEAWYTEAVGFIGITWGSRVWYCPPPTAAGPATCKEAKLVELTKDELEKQKESEKQVHAQ